jgi:hypothetical protein
MSDNILGGLNYTYMLSSSPPLVKFVKSAGRKTPICSGDAVVENTAGQVETGNSITPGESLYSGVSLNYSPANKVANHAVLVTPTAIFDCPINTDDPSFGLRHKGKYSNLAIKDGIAMQSQHRLDASTVAQDEEQDVLIVGPSMMGEILGCNQPRVLIKFNRHRYSNNRVRAARLKRKAGRPQLFADKKAFDKAMKIAFSWADGTGQNQIAYEIDRLLKNGSGKFDARQLRNQCKYFYPSQDWIDIVVRFST